MWRLHKGQTLLIWWQSVWGLLHKRCVKNIPKGRLSALVRTQTVFMFQCRNTSMCTWNDAFFLCLWCRTLDVTFTLQSLYSSFPTFFFLQQFLKSISYSFKVTSVFRGGDMATRDNPQSWQKALSCMNIYWTIIIKKKIISTCSVSWQGISACDAVRAAGLHGMILVHVDWNGTEVNEWRTPHDCHDVSCLFVAKWAALGQECRALSSCSSKVD